MSKSNKTNDRLETVELEKHFPLMRKTHFRLYRLIMTIVREGHLEGEEGDKLKKLLEIMEANVKQIARTAEAILCTSHKNKSFLSDDALKE